MKRLILAAMIAGTPNAAMACNPEMLTLNEWSVSPDNARMYGVTANLTYNGEKAVQMIDGYIAFEDVLGADLSFAIPVPRDDSLTPGQQFDFATRSQMWNGEFRILELPKESVVSITCVRAVQYADGTVERFD